MTDLPPATRIDLALPGQLYNQPSAAPSRKVASAGLFGGAAAIVTTVWEFVRTTWLPELPALPVEAVAFVVALIAFASAYFQRDRKAS